MADIYTISIGGTALVTLTGLYDEIVDDYINDATVTGELLDHEGTVVTTFTASYKASSDGIYQATVPASTTADLKQFVRYIIRVTATSGGSTYISDICAVAQRSE